MVNRGRVGAIFARGRAPVILVLLLVGGALLLKRDLTSPNSDPEDPHPPCPIPSVFKPPSVACP